MHFHLFLSTSIFFLSFHLFLSISIFFLSSLYKWSCLHISLLNPCLNEVEAYPTTRLLPLLCSTFLTNSLLRLFCYLSATCQLTLWNIIGSRLESLNRTFNWQDVFWASKCHHCSIFELYKWTIGRSCKWNLPSCSFEDEGTERVSTSYRPNLFWSSFFFFFCRKHIIHHLLGNLVDYDQVELVEINKFNQSNFSFIFLKIDNIEQVKKIIYDI